MVTEEFVRKQLSSLKSDAATGFNILGAKVSNCSAHVISALITRIINKSVSLFPSRWKCARVTPIFKGGNPTDMNCYRPISVLPLLSKILERHVFDTLYDYCLAYELLSSYQSGFRRNHSCQTLLIRLTDCLLDNMDKCKISGLTYANRSILWTTQYYSRNLNDMDSTTKSSFGSIHIY